VDRRGLVAHVDEVDPGAQGRVEDGHHVVPGKGEDAPDAVGDQRAGKGVRSSVKSM
jgi:hypothetical protein